MTTPLLWSTALTTCDEERSRRAMSDYLLRRDRPELTAGQLIDVLLRWKFDTAPAPVELALLALAAVFDRTKVECDSLLEHLTLASLISDVLGWKLCAGEALTYNEARPSYRALSRAAVIGLDHSVMDAVPLIAAAHTVCTALHSCRFAEAAQALAVVCVHLANSADQPGSVIARFADQGQSHLNALADAHGSAALTWEMRLVAASFKKSRRA